MQRLSRRALLAAAGAGVVGLAGCSGSDAGTTDAQETATQTATAESTEMSDGMTATSTPDGMNDGGTTTEQMDGDGTTTEQMAGDDRTWYTEPLTNVRTGETFTIESLNEDGPVLLETFTIWCSRCQSQQVELRTFHEEAPENVTTVALNVDPNEDRSAVADHAEENDFDWRYAVAPSAVTQSLVAEFDRSITVPPRVPMVRLCPGGDATRLPDGFKSTDELLSGLDSC